MIESHEDLTIDLIKFLNHSLKITILGLNLSIHLPNLIRYFYQVSKIISKFISIALGYSIEF